MASDVNWVARFRAESQRIAEYDPEYAAALPTTVLLGEIDRLQAELDGSVSLRDALRRRLEEARAEIRRLTALLRDHDDCATCGHERRQHGRDPVLRRDWCSGCTTRDDLHEFKEPAPSTGLRGLLEHVGIDVAGRAITVAGVPIDDVGVAPMAKGPYPKPAHGATVASDRCPRCAGDNTEPWALCPPCQAIPKESLS